MDSQTAANPFGEVYEEIKHEMVLLHWTWQTYRQLFATSEARFMLLAELLPDFGALIQQVLADAVVLGICRLCDKAEIGGKRNLTFDRLRSSLNPVPSATQSKLLDAKVAEIEAAVAALREHRNKRLAHLDLPNALSAASALPALSRQRIEDALKPMRELMNQVTDWNNAAEIHFYPYGPGGVDALIDYLRRAKRLRELQDDYHVRRLSVEAVIEKLALRQIPAI